MALLAPEQQQVEGIGAGYAMKSVRWRFAVPHAENAAGLAVVAVYADWATGLRPFTALVYLSVGIPVALLACVAVIGGANDSRCSRTPRVGVVTLRFVRPWLVLLMMAAGLEGLSLALGGRSTNVPTLSTVIDYALAWHPVRFVLFCGWLTAGGVPVVQVVRARSRRGDLRW